MVTVLDAGRPVHPRLSAMQSKRSFVVWLPSPVGYAHADALAELAVAVHHGLKRLGHDASLSRVPEWPVIPPGGTPIVVGPHILSMLPPLELPEDVILYNTEGFGVGLFADALPHLVAHPRQVWDISAHNVDQLMEHHKIAAQFVPPGHDDHAFDSCAEEKDIDVLFYGTMNDRRRKVLQALRDRGLTVHDFHTPYGRGRDEYIRRAKIVLNVLFYEDPGIFQSVRVSYLLNNQELVVSERGVGQFPYDQAAVCVPYDDLVEVCSLYVREPELRIRRAALGPIVMRRFLDTPTLLARALDAVEPDPVAVTAPHGTPPTLCLVVLGKDTATFASTDFLERAQREADELVLIKTKDARFGGLSEIVNRIASRTRCQVVGFVHADTTFGEGALSKFALAAHGGPNGERQVVGLVGITLAREYVWSKAVPPGTQRPVSTLDGCSVFFPTSLIADGSLSFDERFKSFHCSVEDFCLAAAERRVPVVVPSAPADHYSEARGTFKQPDWQSAYWKDRKVLGEKWPITKFETT